MTKEKMPKTLTWLILTISLSFVVQSHALIFYTDRDFRGRSWEVADGWAINFRCNSVPSWINDQISSVNTQGYCVVVYENGGCSGAYAFIGPGTSGHSFTGDLAMNDRISSFRQCTNSEWQNARDWTA